MPDKNISDEIAGLAEAVRGLRDREVAGELAALRAEVEKLRDERAGHSCHGCHCGHGHCNWGHCGCWTFHGHVPGTVAWYPQTLTVTCGSSGTVTAAGGYLSAGNTTSIAVN